MANQITELADIIYRLSDSSPDLSVPYIDFWLRNNIGQLNSRLDVCFSVVDNDFSPQLNEEEKDIFRAIFMVDWYKRQITRFTGAGAYSISDQVTQLKENGRTVTIAPRNNTAKIIIDLRRDLISELQQMVIAYRFNRADPRESKVVEDYDCYDYSYNSYRSREF